MEHREGPRRNRCEASVASLPGLLTRRTCPHSTMAMRVPVVLNPVQPARTGRRDAFVKRDGAPQGQPRGVPVRFHDILGPA